MPKTKNTSKNVLTKKRGRPKGSKNKKITIKLSKRPEKHKSVIDKTKVIKSKQKAIKKSVNKQQSYSKPTRRKKTDAQLDLFSEVKIENKTAVKCGRTKKEANVQMAVPVKKKVEEPVIYPKFGAVVVPRVSNDDKELSQKDVKKICQSVMKAYGYYGCINSLCGIEDCRERRYHVQKFLCHRDTLTMHFKAVMFDVERLDKKFLVTRKSDS